MLCNALGCLKELTNLKCKVSNTYDGDIRLKNELSKGCPKLRSLTVVGDPAVSSLLVHNVAKQLHVLIVKAELHFPIPGMTIPPSESIVDVTLPLSYLDTISGMTRLRSLRLLCDGSSPLWFEKNIQCARACINHIHSIAFFAPPHFRDQREMMVIICMLAPHLKKCTHVFFHGWKCAGIITERMSMFIESMGGPVEHYLLLGCRIYHLEQIERIASVQSVRAVLHPDVEECEYVSRVVHRLRMHPQKSFHISFQKVQSMLGRI